jgi:hypothetical protein
MTLGVTGYQDATLTFSHRFLPSQQLRAIQVAFQSLTISRCNLEHHLGVRIRHFLSLNASST